MDKLTFQKGFSTIEIMIALAIMSVTLTAVVLTSFGTQGMLISSDTNAEAMNKAQELLEQQQALGRKDFNLVNNIATTTDGIYKKWVSVITPPASSGLDPFLTKQVTVYLQWIGERGQTQRLNFMTVVTNFNNAIGGNTCSSVATGNWNNPTVSTPLLLSTYVPGAYSIGSIDAYKGRLYVAATSTSAANMPTLFVFDISNPTSPTYIGSIDNATTTQSGIAAVRVAENLTDGHLYAYIASAYAANFATCSQYNNCAQLQVIDVTSPGSFAPSSIKWNFKIPGITGNQAAGNTITYSNGLVFLGLKASGGGGSEFQIISVQSPTALPYVVGQWPSSGNIGNDVNKIEISEGHAYIAHPIGTYNEQVTVVDISTPASPSRTGSFLGAGGLGNGKDLFMLGDTLFLGRTATNNTGPVPDSIPELYMLNAETPGTILSTPIASSAATVSGESYNKVFARSNLAYVLTGTTNLLKIFSIDTPAAFTLVATKPLGTSAGTAIDCEGNTLYVGNSGGSFSVVSAN